MPYSILITPAASREIRGLDRPVQRRIKAKLEELAHEPRPDGVRKLQGAEADLYRVRLGDYRIVYKISDKELSVLVVRVRHRSAAYR